MNCHMQYGVQLASRRKEMTRSFGGKLYCSISVV